MADSSQPVYFSLIYSGGGVGGFDSSGIIPAVDVALEEIERNNVLPGYNLTYDRPVDSQVLDNICFLTIALIILYLFFHIAIYTPFFI